MNENLFKDNENLLIDKDYDEANFNVNRVKKFSFCNY